MEYEIDWRSRRPAVVDAAERLFDLLLDEAIIDPTWRLNYTKQYIGLKKRNVSINFLRFLWLETPTVAFRFPEDAAIEDDLNGDGYVWRYRRGRYEISLTPANLASPVLLLMLAERAEREHGGPRIPQAGLQDLHAMLREAKKNLNEIAEFTDEKRSAIERAAGAAEAEANRTREVRANTEDSRREIAAWANEIPKYRENMKELNDHMQRTQDLEERLQAWLKRAVPAGMAGGFQKRRRGFIWSKIVWGTLLVVSLASLAYLAYNDPVRMQVEATFLGALTYLFSRVPYAIPLIWGAIFTGRRFVQTLRLEEEYAHKEVLSGAFESYRNHIEEMEETGSLGEYSGTLIQVFLEMLRAHPGWIFRASRPKSNRLVSMLFGRKVNNE